MAQREPILAPVKRVDLMVPPHSDTRVGLMSMGLWKRHLATTHFRCATLALFDVSKKTLRKPTIAGVNQYRPIETKPPLHIGVGLNWPKLAHSVEEAYRFFFDIRNIETEIYRIKIKKIIYYFQVVIPRYYYRSEKLVGCAFSFRTLGPWFN